jgi:hypothetical protein
MSCFSLPARLGEKPARIFLEETKLKDTRFGEDYVFHRLERVGQPDVSFAIKANLVELLHESWRSTNYLIFDPDADCGLTADEDRERRELIEEYELNCGDIAQIIEKLNRHANPYKQNKLLQELGLITFQNERHKRHLATYNQLSVSSSTSSEASVYTDEGVSELFEEDPLLHAALDALESHLDSLERRLSPSDVSHEEQAKTESKWEVVRPAAEFNPQDESRLDESIFVDSVNQLETRFSNSDLPRFSDPALMSPSMRSSAPRKAAVKKRRISNSDMPRFSDPALMFPSMRSPAPRKAAVEDTPISSNQPKIEELYSQNTFTAINVHDDFTDSTCVSQVEKGGIGQEIPIMPPQPRDHIDLDDREEHFIMMNDSLLTNSFFEEADLSTNPASVSLYLRLLREENTNSRDLRLSVHSRQQTDSGDYFLREDDDRGKVKKNFRRLVERERPSRSYH